MDTLASIVTLNLSQFHVVRSKYTQNLLHTNAFTHGAFTQTHFDTQTL